MSTPQWSPKSTLLQVTDRDTWTIGDSFEGTQILGTNGAGKTSGSGAHVALAMLAAGFGGLILTAKEEETNRWLKLTKQAKRSQDVVIIPSPNGDGKGILPFNFLAYTVSQNEAVASSDLANLLVNAARILSKNHKFEPYWEQRMHLVLVKLIDLARAADSLSITMLRNILCIVPSSRNDLEPGRPWANLITDIRRHLAEKKHGEEKSKTLSEDELEELETEEVKVARWHFEERIVSVPDRQREGFVDPLFTLLSVFETGLIKQLYDPAVRPDNKDLSLVFAPSLKPECCYEGKIFIFNFPTNVNQDNAKVAQVIYKQTWQLAMQRRFDKKIDKPGFDLNQQRPVFVYVDEAQRFLVPQDSDFQPFARSARVATVYLTQTLSAYVKALGREEAFALLGNLQTKFFHNNGDPETNDFAMKTIGKSSGSQWGHEDSWDNETGELNNTRLEFSRDANSDRSRSLDTGDFNTLRTGCDSDDEEDDKMIDAYMFKAGRVWKGNGMRNWTDIVFKRWM